MPRVFLVALLVTVALRVENAFAITLYVRTTGNDEQTKPTTPERALRTIGSAARMALAGDRVVVGPGTYREGDIKPTAFGFVEFVADRRGVETADPAGDVIVDASGFASGFELNRNVAVKLDGFVIYGAANGIHVKSDSDHAIVSNNVVSDCTDAGILVRDSKNVTVFNNLVYDNGGDGILVTGSVTGSAGVVVANTTAYGNAGRGIFLSGDEIGSPEGLILNNVLQGNATAGIQVNESSRGGYRSAGNVSADRWASGTPVDATEVQADPLLLDPDGSDGILGGPGYADDRFQLSHRRTGQEKDSPAVDAGSDWSRRLRLHRSSTRSDGRRDGRRADAGYHYDNFLTAPPPSRLRRRLRTATLFVHPLLGNDGHGGARPRRALRTLGRALELARPGHRILLLPGTYREGTLTVPRSGRPGREIVVQGQPGAVIDAGGARQSLLISGQSHLRLVGLEVRGSTGAGVEIRNGASQVEIRRCVLHEHARRGLLVRDSSGVIVRGSVVANNDTRGVQMLDATVDMYASTVFGNGDQGIWLTDGSALLLEDSKVYGNVREGLLAEDGTVTVRRTAVEENGGDGVRLTTSSGQILSSVLSNNAGDGLSSDGAPEVTVESCTVAMNTVSGLRLGNTGALSVFSSVLHTNGGDGIAVLDSPGALLWNNLIYANGSTGVVVSGNLIGSAGAEVLNNTVFGNLNRGVLIGGSDLQPASGGATVRHNIFQANLIAGIQVNRLSLSGYSGDYNLSTDPYGALTPIGFHDVLADARFVEPAGADGILGGIGAMDDDFHLSHPVADQRMTSPAVDAGAVTARIAGLGARTTRTDGIADSGMVDLGYHYPLP